MVNIKLKDGSVIQTEEGLTVKEIAEKLSRNLAKMALGASVDGKIVGLTQKIESD